MGGMSGLAVITLILPMKAVTGYQPITRTSKTAILIARVIGLTKNLMTTIIEKDSSAPAILLTIVFLIVVTAGGLEFADMHGTFGRKTTVIENNKTVENKTVILPAQNPEPAHEFVPEPARPEQPPAH